LKAPEPPKEGRTKGPEDQRAKGSEDQGTRGPRERTEGPGDSKTTRFENCIQGYKRAKTLHQRRKKCFLFIDALNFDFLMP